MTQVRLKSQVSLSYFSLSTVEHAAADPVNNLARATSNISNSDPLDIDLSQCSVAAATLSLNPNKQSYAASSLSPAKAVARGAAFGFQTRAVHVVQNAGAGGASPGTMAATTEQGMMRKVQVTTISTCWTMGQSGIATLNCLGSTPRRALLIWSTYLGEQVWGTNSGSVVWDQF
jgi:hypothetical protein